MEPDRKHLTAREAYLLGWCVRVPGRTLLRMTPRGRWCLDGGRTSKHEPPEGARLIEEGLVVLRIGQGKSHPAFITEKGREALKSYMEERHGNQVQAAVLVEGPQGQPVAAREGRARRSDWLQYRRDRAAVAKDQGQRGANKFWEGI